MKRRDFLKILASAGAGLAASQLPFVRRLVQSNPIEPRWTDYEESNYISACGLCPMGCSIRVRRINGFPVSVQGNPHDPRTGGGLCVKGLSMLQQLYHPDRLKTPMKRSGARGGDQWQIVSWDEALNGVAEVLRKQVHVNPRGLVFLNGRPLGLMNKLIDHWMHFLGSPHHVADGYQHALPIATVMMMGGIYRPGYRLDELDLVVSVGDAFLDFTEHPVARTHQYARFRDRVGGTRGHLILFDDQRGVTAEKADEFYRLEPGTYSALILSLANVIVRYELYDADFIRKYTLGLEEWKQKVLLKYPPEIVESITGVPSSVIYNTAIRLARSKQKIVLAGIPAMSGPGGLHAAMAMLALNLLLGCIDRSLKFLTPLEDWIYPGKHFPQNVGEQNRLGANQFPLGLASPWVIPNLARENHRSIQTLIFYHSNPVASHPDGNRWIELLQSAESVVSFSPFLDETSRYADWILPDSHFLERYGDIIPASTNMPVMTLTQPFAEEPMYDTRPTGDVLLDLIRRVNPAAEEEFPWDSYQDLLEEAMIQLYTMESGTFFRSPDDYTAFLELASKGYWESEVEDEDQFIEKFYERGGWVQPVYMEGQWSRLFRTTSGKFEFASSTMRRMVEDFLLHNNRTWKDMGLEKVIDTFHMPEFIDTGFVQPTGKITYLITWNCGSLGELPWWWEVVGMHRYIQWTMWAEIGTHDPERGRLDVQHKKTVECKISGRNFKFPLVYRYRGHPRVIILPVGFGRDIHRATPLPRGINLFQHIPYTPDPLTGIPGFYFTVESLNESED